MVAAQLLLYINQQELPSTCCRILVLVVPRVSPQFKMSEIMTTIKI